MEKWREKKDGNSGRAQWEWKNQRKKQLCVNCMLRKREKAKPIWPDGDTYYLASRVLLRRPNTSLISLPRNSSGSITSALHGTHNTICVSSMEFCNFFLTQVRILFITFTHGTVESAPMDKMSGGY